MGYSETKHDKLKEWIVTAEKIDHNDGYTTKATFHAALEINAFTCEEAIEKAKNHLDWRYSIMSVHPK